MKYHRDVVFIIVTHKLILWYYPLNVTVIFSYLFCYF